MSAFVLLLSAGQVLLKKAAMAAKPISGAAGFLPLLASAWFWLALALYGSAILLWMVILQKTPLVTAYPFAGLSFVLVPLAAWLWMGEGLSPAYVAGALLIISGVILTAGVSP